MANSLYGTYEYITDNYVVAGAKQRLGIKNSTEDDLYLKDLCNEGVKELRNLYTLIPAVATLQIVGGKAKLPEGFVRFNKGNYPIIYVNQDGLIDSSGVGNAIAPVSNNMPFYTDSPFPMGEGYFPYSGVVNVENGYLFFEGGVDRHFVKIAYLSTNIDENGSVRIPAICERTITAYICWKYSMTIKDRPDIIGAYQFEFKKGKQHLRGLSAMPNSNENEYLFNQMNKLP